MRTGIIRSYDNVTGAGSLLDFNEEATLNFTGFAGLNFVAGSRVKFTLAHPGNSIDPAVVGDLQAE